MLNLTNLLCDNKYNVIAIFQLSNWELPLRAVAFLDADRWRRHVSFIRSYFSELSLLIKARLHRNMP